MIKKLLLLVGLFTFYFDSVAQSTNDSLLARINIIKANINKYFIDEATGYYKEKTILKPGDKAYSYLWPLCGLIQAANEAEVYTKKTGFFDSVLQSIQVYYDPSVPAASYGSYIVKEKKRRSFL